MNDEQSLEQATIQELNDLIEQIQSGAIVVVDCDTSRGVVEGRPENGHRTWTATDSFMLQVRYSKAYEA